MAEQLTLNLAALRKDTRMVGPGLRDALWVQGCSIGCPGCANQGYLAHETRVVLPVDRLIEHFRHRVGRISGVSALGGEPTEQAPAVASLFHALKELGLTTVLFSGRSYEFLQRHAGMTALLEATDLLIDGPFLLDQFDPTLHWRGSRNQRLLRLSDAFSEADLFHQGANGEVLISEGWTTWNGIGTRYQMI